MDTEINEFNWFSPDSSFLDDYESARSCLDHMLKTMGPAGMDSLSRRNLIEYGQDYTGYKSDEEAFDPDY